MGPGLQSEAQVEWSRKGRGQAGKCSVCLYGISDGMGGRIARVQAVNGLSALSWPMPPPPQAYCPARLLGKPTLQADCPSRVQDQLGSVTNNSET